MVAPLIGAVAEILLGADRASAPERPRSKNMDLGGVARGVSAFANSRRSPQPARSTSSPRASRSNAPPAPPPMPASQPYRAPKPVYSNADYQRALQQDFDFAANAAGVARNNQIAVERARASAQANAQARVVNAQGNVQSRLQREAAAAASASAAQGFGYQTKLNQQGFSNQSALLGQQGQIQSNLLGKSFAGQAGLQNNAARLQQQAIDANFNRNFNAQLGLLNAARGGSAPAKASRNGGNFDMASQLSARSVSVGGGIAKNRANLFQGEEGVALERAISQRRLENVKAGRPIDWGLSGGSSGGGAGGSGGSDPAAIAATLAREQLAAQERMAAGNIALQDRDRTERLASAERMQGQQLQLQRELPGIQATAEEDLRKKARQAALSVFNTARPGREPSATAWQG